MGLLWSYTLRHIYFGAQNEKLQRNTTAGVRQIASSPDVLIKWSFFRLFSFSLSLFSIFHRWNWLRWHSIDEVEKWINLSFCWFYLLAQLAFAQAILHVHCYTIWGTIDIIQHSSDKHSIEFSSVDDVLTACLLRGLGDIGRESSANGL